MGYLTTVCASAFTSFYQVQLVRQIIFVLTKQLQSCKGEDENRRADIIRVFVSFYTFFNSKGTKRYYFFVCGARICILWP